MAGEGPNFAGLILKLQLYQQITGILMIEAVSYTHLTLPTT